MLEKTDGIVLHTIKHSDSGIVSHVYTRKLGRLSFMVKGLSSRKGNTRRVYFQVLQPLSLEFYYREKKDLHMIKEASPLLTFSSIPFDIRRNSMAVFLAEVLYKALGPEGPDEQLFEYIFEAIRFLDDPDSPADNFHIGFIIGLARYLGIAPSNNYSNELCYFDMQNGVFASAPPFHGYYMEKVFSGLLNSFLVSSISECNKISLSGSFRKDFLNDILAFYSLHIPGLRNINSIQVYSDIFNGQSDL